MTGETRRLGDRLTEIMADFSLQVSCRGAPECWHYAPVDFEDWLARFGDVTTAHIRAHGRCMACGMGGATTTISSHPMYDGRCVPLPPQPYLTKVPRSMCGRYSNTLTWEQIVTLYRLTFPAPSNLQPRYNIAPTQQVLAVTEDDQGRKATMMRWGFIPSWAKEPLKASTINARAETILEKPMWREPFKRARCIIPACGFYEWKAEGNLKQPYRIERADGQPMSFAGLWAHNERLGVTSCAIIVTSASEPVMGVHDRMPVILEAEDFERWLSEPAVDLLKPSEVALRVFPVNRDVGNVKNDRPDLIEPLPQGGLL